MDYRKPAMTSSQPFPAKITIRGEPGAGAWVEVAGVTDLSEFGAPSELSDAIEAWHNRWFWDTFNPDGLARERCDADGLAFARAVKTWVGASVVVIYVAVDGQETVVEMRM